MLVEDLRTRACLQATIQALDKELAAYSDLPDDLYFQSSDEKGGFMTIGQLRAAARFLAMLDMMDDTGSVEEWLTEHRYFGDKCSPISWSEGGARARAQAAMRKLAAAEGMAS